MAQIICTLSTKRVVLMYMRLRYSIYRYYIYKYLNNMIFIQNAIIKYYIRTLSIIYTIKKKCICTIVHMYSYLKERERKKERQNT